MTKLLWQEQIEIELAIEHHIKVLKKRIEFFELEGNTESADRNREYIQIANNAIEKIKQMEKENSLL